jgi:hypothetical protein
MPEERGQRRAFHEQAFPPKAQYTPPVHEAAEEPKEGFKDRLVAQGIISGIILMVVLILRLTDHPYAVDVRASLNNALSGTVTTEQVADEVRRLLAIGEETVLPVQIPVQLPVQSEVPEEAEPFATTRIDEDVLRELSEWTDDLQPTAPDPMDLPEL